MTRSEGSLSGDLRYALNGDELKKKIYRQATNQGITESTKKVVMMKAQKAKYIAEHTKTVVYDKSMRNPLLTL